jgi:hypothetical protein
MTGHDATGDDACFGTFTQMLNNPTLYARNLVNFGPLETALRDLGHPITFMDVDMMLNIAPWRSVDGKPHFLVVEWKAPGGELQGGQTHTFRSMRQLENVTVLVVHGLDGIPESIEEFGEGPRWDCDLLGLARYVADWHDKRVIRKA